MILKKLNFEKTLVLAREYYMNIACWGEIELL